MDSISIYFCKCPCHITVDVICNCDCKFLRTQTTGTCSNADEIKQLREENEKLKEWLTSREDELNRRVRQLNSSDSERLKLHEENEKLRKDNDRVYRNSIELQAQYKAKIEKAEQVALDAATKYSEAVDKYLVEQDKSIKLKAENEKYQFGMRDNCKLRLDILRLEEENERLKAEELNNSYNESFKSSISFVSHRAFLDDAYAEIKQLIHDNEKLKAENKQHIDNIEKLKGAICEMTAKNMVGAPHLYDHNCDCDKCVIEKLKSENENLKPKLERSFDLHFNNADKIDGLQRQIVKEEVKNYQLRDENEQLKAQLQQAQCTNCYGKGIVTIGSKSDKDGYCYPVDVNCSKCAPERKTFLKHQDVFCKKCGANNGAGIYSFEHVNGEKIICKECKTQNCHR